jgi:endonuclease/exonuclease/phosphatase family metal-dependent hydrolase
MRNHPLRPGFALVALGALATAATAQWNPPTGQWGKQVASDVRVMTWNVQDSLCSSNAKVEGANNWCAQARIVAALKPDVLLLQECGDNSGNGTGSGVDTVAELTAVIDDFLHGGTDSFNGNTAVTAYVQKYASGYDLPYVYVSSDSDGFNRNVILSRWPFADLNGDGKSTYADIPTVTASQWAPGGDGGIRGFQFAEIDLPNSSYSGNLVVGGAHLKSGGTTSDSDQRITAAKNVSYVVRYWYNGGGGSTPDPLGKIADAPVATSVLPAGTPVILGGDWNEDEFINGQKGPAEWLAQALTQGGTSDGTDRDGTDATFEHSLHYFSGSDATHSSGDKLDYLLWQDSVVNLRLSSFFLAGSNPASAQPPELSGYPNPQGASAMASDHRPVFADFILGPPDCNANGIADSTDISSGTSSDYNANAVPDDCECFALNYCTANPNSTGASAQITSSGSNSVSANNLTLVGSSAPPNVSAMFLASRNATQVPFGNGILCVGSSGIFRLGAQSVDAFGAIARVVNFNVLPAGMSVLGGQVWHFQLWHRDPFAGGSNTNTSNGRRIAFCP